GIEGAIHAIRQRVAPTDTPPPPDNDSAASQVDSAPTTQDNAPLPDDSVATGLTLIDAHHGFNELGRLAMLWTVRHHWAKGARFAFNCYRHSAQLILHSPGRAATILHSKEGVTQGDPLSMVLYALALLPLVEELRALDSTVLQPWYADDAALHGDPQRSAKVFKALLEKGPDRGYFPEPEKSWHICSAETELAARQAFATEGLTVQFSRGHRYVGGFIGSADTQADWLQPQVATWAAGVRALARIAWRYPQSAYAGLTMSLQAEWQYLMWTIPGIGPALAPIEAVIWDDFLPSLFGADALDADLRELLALSIQQGGLGIPNPVTSADACYAASTTSTMLLTESLLEGTALSYTAHRTQVRLSRTQARATRAAAESEILNQRQVMANQTVKNRLERGKHTGAWLTVIPNTLNGTELSREEFRDNLRLRFGFLPLQMQRHCDGCGDRLTMEHALNCTKGGLVLLHHNDTANEWGDLCAKALTPSAVSHEPTIFPSGTAASDRVDADQGCTSRGPSIGLDARGDKGVEGFWAHRTTCIFDIRITNTESRRHRGASPASILAKEERQKKDKYLDTCLEHCRHFTPLIYSVDGMAGLETQAAEKRLASLLARKWTRAYSEMVGFVRARLALAVVRANTLLIRGTRRRGRTLRPIFDDGAGISLAARAWTL
ncbi:MAG: hypothetical protein P8Z33_13945, partial [Gammaproteobacteria bacterium]